MLKDLRKSMATKLGVPSYVIFQESSLEQMATIYPVTIEELQQVQGVGVGKAKRYGGPFLELIAKHCRDNQIERPGELRVRTVAKTSWTTNTSTTYTTILPRVRPTICAWLCANWGAITPTKRYVLCASCLSLKWPTDAFPLFIACHCAQVARDGMAEGLKHLLGNVYGYR